METIWNNSEKQENLIIWGIDLSKYWLSNLVEYTKEEFEFILEDEKKWLSPWKNEIDKWESGEYYKLVDTYLDYYFEKQLETYSDLQNTPENKEKYKKYIISKIKILIDLNVFLRKYSINHRVSSNIIKNEMKPIYEEFSEIFSHGNEINYYTEKVPLNLWLEK